VGAGLGAGMVMAQQMMNAMQPQHGGGGGAPPAQPQGGAPVAPAGGGAPATADTKFCMECGQRIPRSSKFCPECGKPLG
jgi:membrane protease subunit (stomatin/prohibitin family)